MGGRATESRITRPIDILSAALQVGAFTGVFHLSFFYHLIRFEASLMRCLIRELLCA